ncbi:NUMOD4 motif-containing HNH endonuclease [Nocardia sp. NPDC019302]|uniref:NUMOD4 motif-containing HNH endonuclease n=1 Tax=Nocardia sp. NPDC019302 TaxID=3154592 RepID=UPI0033EEB81E
MTTPPQITGVTERWRPVVGWEGLYEVSDQGAVRSLERRVVFSDGRARIQPGRLLGQHRTQSGHLTVRLSLNKSSELRKVHRLVLLAFVGPPPPGTECCHNDGDATNNRVENLRWDTRSANTLDKVAHGNHPNASKTHCVNGHEFTPDNTYLRRRGRGRACKSCALIQKRARRARLLKAN